MKLKNVGSFFLPIFASLVLLSGCYRFHVSMDHKSEKEYTKDGERFVDVTETNKECKAFGPCPGC